MNYLEKLAEIAHKSGLYVTKDEDLKKVLGLLVDSMSKKDQADFYRDTFMMMEDEIDALYDCVREPTEEELQSLYEEEVSERQRYDALDIQAEMIVKD